MAKQTKITIETGSLLILTKVNPMRAWCPRCGAEGEMIALENTEVMSALGELLGDEWLNSGEPHRSRAADGSTLICLPSLLARVRNEKRR